MCPRVREDLGFLSLHFHFSIFPVPRTNSLVALVMYDEAPKTRNLQPEKSTRRPQKGGIAQLSKEPDKQGRGWTLDPAPSARGSQRRGTGTGATPSREWEKCSPSFPRGRRSTPSRRQRMSPPQCTRFRSFARILSRTPPRRRARLRT